ncbi:MAG: hypothetical protein LBF65_01780, partial [Holosporales bacterium]|nr:hypothetical protein [Holosporales bacterium]
MFIFKISALFLMMANVVGWSTHWEFAADFEPFQLTESDDDSYEEDAHHFEVYRYTTFTDFCQRKGKDLNARAGDGSSMRNNVLAIDQLVKWFSTADYHAIEGKYVSLTNAIRNEWKGKTFTGANLNYLFFFEYIRASIGGQSSQDPDLMEQVYRYIQRDVDLGEGNKQDSRMKQLRHDMPIYMEAYGFNEYWGEVGDEITRQIEESEFEKQQEELQKLENTGKDKQLGHLVVVTDSMMRNAQIQKEIKELFETEYDFHKKIHLIQDVGFRKQETHYPPIKSLEADTKSEYDFAIASGARRLSITPAKEYSKTDQDCSILGEVSCKQATITKTFQIPRYTSPTLIKFYAPYQVAWTSLARQMDGTDDILNVTLLSTLLTKSPEHISGEEWAKEQTHITDIQTNILSRIDIYPEPWQGFRDKSITGFPVTDDREETEKQVRNAMQNAAHMARSRFPPEETIIMVSGGMQPIKEKLEGVRKQITDQGIKLPLTVITIDPQERPALKSEYDDNPNAHWI